MSTAAPELLDLDDATLSGGARILAASGGRPRRITTTDLYINTGSPGVANNYASMFWDADGIHVWSVNVNFDIVKVNTVLGTIVAGPFVPPLGENAFCIARGVNGFWVATQSTKLYKYSFSGVLQTTVTLGSAATRVAVPDGQELVAWVSSSHNLGTIREVSLVTGADTGRVLPGGAVHQGPVCAGGSHAPYVYTVAASGMRVDRYLLSTLAVTSCTLNALDIADEPDAGIGTSTLRGSPILDPSNGYAYVLHGSPNNSQTEPPWIERCDFSAGTFTRALWPDRYLPRGLDALTADGGSFNPQSFLAFSDDGTQVAQVKRYTGSPQSFINLYVYTRGTQRARWTRTFDSAVTLLRIDVPGDLGNSYGTSPADSSELDHRRVRCYYALDGGTRVEFVPGSPLDVAVTAGQVLTIDADFELWMTPPCAAPYVGGDAGEGITLVYDDPAATVYTPYAGGELRVTLGAEPNFVIRIN